MFIRRLKSKFSLLKWWIKNHHTFFSWFTLMEIAIVIAIIGILVSLIKVYTSGYQARARDVLRVTDLRTINQSIDGYFLVNGKYPPTRCGATWYDCAFIDQTAFITSVQDEWSTRPLSYLPYHTWFKGISSLMYSIIWPKEAQAFSILPGALETALAPYLPDGILPRDPINTWGIYPWNNKKAYVYSYGNVGILPWQEGFDLTASLENPNNPLACKNRLARYGYNNLVLCDTINPSTDDVINTSFSWISHGLLYEAGQRKWKYDMFSTESWWLNTYEWTSLEWGNFTEWVTCWVATRTREVVCTRKIDFATVSDSLCSVSIKPATSEIGDIGSSTCGWWAWWAYSECSVTCGWWIKVANRTCDIAWHCTNDPDGTTAVQACNTDPCPINGVCNNAVQYACSVWSSTSNIAGSCWWSSTWTCSGLNGWSNDICSKANPACSVAPTGLILSHTAWSKSFSFSLTAGSWNGASCKLQYYRNWSVWTDINANTYNCDTNIVSQAVTLPADGWYAWNWNGTQIRLIRVSDSVEIGIFSQLLSCSVVSGSANSTPNVDEDCNGIWNNLWSVNQTSVLSEVVAGAPYACPSGTYNWYSIQLPVSASWYNYSDMKFYAGGTNCTSLMSIWGYGTLQSAWYWASGNVPASPVWCASTAWWYQAIMPSVNWKSWNCSFSIITFN
jgi:prepilin-type N-terminal cleavage/methylation domain-containing protein